MQVQITATPSINPFFLFFWKPREERILKPNQTKPNQTKPNQTKSKYSDQTIPYQAYSSALTTHCHQEFKNDVTNPSHHPSHHQINLISHLSPLIRMKSNMAKRPAIHIQERILRSRQSTQRPIGLVQKLLQSRNAHAAGLQTIRAPFHQVLAIDDQPVGSRVEGYDFAGRRVVEISTPSVVLANIV